MSPTSRMFCFTCRQCLLGEGLGRPEVQQSRKEDNHTQKTCSQYITNIVSSNTSASLDGGFFSSSGGMIVGHEGHCLSLTNGLAIDAFHYVRPAKCTMPREQSFWFAQAYVLAVASLAEPHTTVE